MAIVGLHAILYSKKAEATRRFFGETLGLRSVDAGGSWLIFTAPPAELAVHPTEGDESHELFLMCDDIDATIAELRDKGVVARAVQDQPWGRLTYLVLPSGDEIGMYQPKHPTAIDRARIK